MSPAGGNSSPVNPSSAILTATAAAQHRRFVAGGNGPNPIGPTFGATVFTSAPGTPDTNAHSEYREDGNIARANFARIVAGQYGQVS
jgi:hypothetical protein